MKTGDRVRVTFEADVELHATNYVIFRIHPHSEVCLNRDGLALTKVEVITKSLEVGDRVRLTLSPGSIGCLMSITGEYAWVQFDEREDPGTRLLDELELC